MRVEEEEEREWEVMKEGEGGRKKVHSLTQLSVSAVVTLES